MHLHELLTAPLPTQVQAAIPKFESEYSLTMNDILIEMGMQDAFDAVKADFSGIGTAEDHLVIDSVIHKTFISVEEQGTKAGAATVVAVAESAAEPQELMKVYLDRPFVYMLIDCENKLPFFIGTMLDPAQ